MAALQIWKQPDLYRKALEKADQEVRSHPNGHSARDPVTLKTPLSIACVEGLCVSDLVRIESPV